MRRVSTQRSKTRRNRGDSISIKASDAIEAYEKSGGSKSMLQILTEIRDSQRPRKRGKPISKLGPWGQPAPLLQTPLLKADGTPYLRYTQRQRLDVLAMTDENLREFKTIFIPRTKPYLRQKAYSNRIDCKWKTIHHHIRNRDILRHLWGLGYCGVFAYGHTTYCCLDVDRHGTTTPEEFAARCREVEACLERLHVNPGKCLVVASPGGGRHYYVFLVKAIWTSSLPNLFRAAGLPIKKGYIEVYPSETQGLRLPFGYIPQTMEPPDRFACVKFLNFFRSGGITQHDPDRLRADALALQAQRENSQRYRRAKRRKSPTKPNRRRRERPNDAHAKRVSKPTTNPSLSYTRSFTDLMARYPWSPEEGEVFEGTPIPSCGRRIEATKRLAWHYRITLDLEQSDAEERLIEYVYRQGAHTSTDVARDIQAATRQVEQQTRNIVRWTYRKFTRHDLGDEGYRGFDQAKQFTRAELAVIAPHVLSMPTEDSTKFLAFILRWLAFAKRHGTKTPDGWMANVPVRQVIRKWPDCSRMRYQRFLNWWLNTGSLTITEDHRFYSDGRQGKCRTYRLGIRPDGASPEISLESALSEIQTGGVFGSPLVERLWREELLRSSTPSTTNENHGVVLDPLEGSRRQDELALTIKRCDAGKDVSGWLTRQECPEDLAYLLRTRHCYAWDRVRCLYMLCAYLDWLISGRSWRFVQPHHLSLRSFVLHLTAGRSTQTAIDARTKYCESHAWRDGFTSVDRHGTDPYERLARCVCPGLTTSDLGPDNDEYSDNESVADDEFVFDENGYSDDGDDSDDGLDANDAWGE